jgi:hypothetical protein
VTKRDGQIAYIKVEDAKPIFLLCSFLCLERRGSLPIPRVDFRLLAFSIELLRACSFFHSSGDKKDLLSSALLLASSSHLSFCCVLLLFIFNLPLSSLVVALFLNLMLSSS